MKNVNTSENESFVVDFFNQKIKGFNFNFIRIAVITILISQSVYSKNYLKVNTIEKNDNLLELKQVNEPQKVAEYPGGLEKFYAVIISNFEDLDIDHEGFSKINVSFVIEKDGSLSDITVNESKMSASMKNNIISALKAIKTKWSPAEMNNQAVKTGYNLPIVFI